MSSSKWRQSALKKGQFLSDFSILRERRRQTFLFVSDSGRFNDDVAEFNAVYGDASSESSDEQLDIAIKEAFRGRQMTKDRPIIRPLVIRPDSEEEVDSLEPKIDAKQDKLEKMLEQELARVKQEEFKNIDVRDDYVEDDFDKQDRADIRARIQELMQQKASKNDGDLCEVSCYSNVFYTPGSVLFLFR